MKNLNVRQNRNERLKEKTTKQNSHQNPFGPCCTPQSGPFFQGSAHSVVALLVFHNLLCSWVSDGHIPQMWPSFPFDEMWSAWQELFYRGQDCLQINSGFWKQAKLELYSCLAGCVPLHMDCRESINHFSVSHHSLQACLWAGAAGGCSWQETYKNRGKGQRRPAFWSSISCKNQAILAKSWLDFKRKRKS